MSERHGAFVQHILRPDQALHEAIEFRWQLLLAEVFDLFLVINCDILFSLHLWAATTAALMTQPPAARIGRRTTQRK
jgi:hypothetical protein